MKNLKVLSAIFILFLSGFMSGSPSWASEHENGKKVRVAVARFGATDRFAQVYGGWDIGGGLSAQLVTELIDTGQVIVVERAILSQIMREQELSASKLVTKETAAQVGQLLGVDYLIVGQVTEFEQKAIGGGGRAGFFTRFLPKVSAEFTAAHVGIDLRIIDTSTGEILRSHRAVGRAWEKAVAIDLSFPTLSFGGDAFHKTPLGKATRKVIGESLQFVLGAVQERLSSYASWIGKVIHVDEQSIYVNAGTLAQVQIGDRLSVFSIKQVLTDPETNQVVGLIEEAVGELVVTTAKEKFSTARIVNATKIPKKGDIVRFAESFASPSLGGDLEAGEDYQQLSYSDGAQYSVLE